MRPAPHLPDADLSAYLDGELPAERRRKVEAWLAESEEARRRLAELRAVSDQLAALPRLRAPKALAAALARAAERRQLFGEDAPERRLQTYRATARLLAAAAVLLVVVGIGYYSLAPPRPAPVRFAQPHEPLGAEGRAALPPAEPLAQATAPPEAQTAKTEGEPTLAESPETPALSPGAARLPEIAAARAAAVGDVPEPPAEYGLVGPPGWHGLAQETHTAGAGRAVIDVTITPASAVEYAATVAVLNDWENRGLTSPTEGDEPVTQQIASAGSTTATAVAQVFELEPGDLSYRLNQLAFNAPRQVFVQMSFVAAPDDILSQVVRLPPEVTRYALFRIGGTPGAEMSQPPSATESPRSPGQPERTDAHASQPPAWSAPQAAASRADRPPPTAEPPATGPSPAGPPKAAPPTRRETDSVGAQAPLSDLAPDAIPGRAAANLETRSTQRLLNLVLRGQQSVGAPALRSPGLGAVPGDPGGAAERSVLFRVRLLPPLGAEAPSAAAATAATDTAATGAAAVGSPAEPANPTTMPGTEAPGPSTSPQPGPPAESR